MGADSVSVCDSDNIDAAVSLVTDVEKQEEFKELLQKLVKDTIDAALVMTVVPACESLEDMDAIEKNKIRFC